MRKWVFFILFMSFINLTACSMSGAPQNSLDIGEENKYAFDESGNVTLSIDDSTITPFGAEFTIHNNADQEIGFGKDFSIQTQIDNKWYDLEPGNVDWTAEMFTISPNGSRSFDVDWTLAYGELPNGNYRLVKEYSVSQDFIDDSYIFCEFEITE